MPYRNITPEVRLAWAALHSMHAHNALLGVYCKVRHILWIILVIVHGKISQAHIQHKHHMFMLWVYYIQNRQQAEWITIESGWLCQKKNGTTERLKQIWHKHLIYTPASFIMSNVEQFPKRFWMPTTEKSHIDIIIVHNVSWLTLIRGKKHQTFSQLWMLWLFKRKCWVDTHYIDLFKLNFVSIAQLFGLPTHCNALYRHNK